MSAKEADCAWMRRLLVGDEYIIACNCSTVFICVISLGNFQASLLFVDSSVRQFAAIRSLCQDACRRVGGVASLHLPKPEDAGRSGIAVTTRQRFMW